jgi:molybdate-binding protein
VPLRIQASHGFAVEALRHALLRRNTPIELKYRDCDEALNALVDDDCDLAGLHVPTGALEEAALRHYADRMRENWSIVHLATRRQGLIVAPGNPLGIRSIADLARPGIRYVNRQSGSGTRLVFDLLRADAGVDARAIDGYETLEYTHAAIAAYVGSGMADAGFGLEVPARRFGLDFEPLVTDRYFFVCREALLAEPRMTSIVAALRDRALRAEIDRLPGYDASRAGDIEPVRNLFPMRAPHPVR